MTREEFICDLLESYTVAGTLSNKNGCSVLRLRHKVLDRDIVLRSYSSPVAAYEKLNNICHPNLVEVLDCYTLSDGQIVIEEFVDGITVAQVLQSGYYTYSGAKKILQGVGSALVTLHQMGLVHRDIKPDNIILTKNGEVKLFDLNASRVVSSGKKSDTVVLGTVGYAPPEQFGIAQSDKRSDIYALGILLNVMITGLHPSERLAKGKAGKIVLKCTQIDPERRFPSAEKFLEAL